MLRILTIILEFLPQPLLSLRLSLSFGLGLLFALQFCRQAKEPSEQESCRLRHSP
jgi:hypothetical protein